jgi:hypothetical protein
VERLVPGERIRVDSLFIAEDLESHGAAQSVLLAELRARLMIAAECDPYHACERAGEKIYLSRQGSPTKRAIENGDQFFDLAASRGFREVRMERLPLAEQIRIAASSDFILAPHGAGLFHALFMSRGEVLELFPVDADGHHTNEPCWERILDVHRLEGRSLGWRALESKIRRLHPQHRNQFTIVADVGRVADLLSVANASNRNQWCRIPILL